MPNRNCLAVLILAALLGAIVPARQPRASSAFCDSIVGNLITNCGFEDGDSGWTFTTSAVGVVAAPNPTHSGVNVGVVNAYPGFGVLRQSIATIPGDQYLLEFWLASNGGSGEVFAQFAGATRYDQDPPPIPGDGSFHLISLIATATDTSSIFQLGGAGITATYFFDDVAITDLSIPEPASLAFLAIGSAGLALARRQVRRSQLDIECMT